MKKIKHNLLLLLFFVVFIIMFNCSKNIPGYATSFDSLKIHFTNQGKGEPAIVFVHGWGSDRTRWECQMNYFSDNHQVVSIDLPGFGESGNQRENWSMEAYGKDIVSVLDILSIKDAILVGHSMGTYAVLEAAKIAPNKIIGLVPVDMLQNVEEVYTEEQLKERIALFENYANSLSDSISIVGWNESINEAMNYRKKLPEVLKSIAAPIICINSDQSITQVDIARKYSKSFDAYIIEGTGHAVMVDAPEKFNETLNKIVKTI